jgi:hypothetical protein
VRAVALREPLDVQASSSRSSRIEDYWSAKWQTRGEMMVVNGRGAVSVLRRDTPHMSIYFFFDESGNLDFSPNGTPYYCFGVLSTHDPAPLTQALTALRYDMLAEGLELERFHAAEDRQTIRDRVFAAIIAVGEFDFDCVVIEKRKVNPELHRDGRFYPHFAGYLLRHVFERSLVPNERIVLITDRLPMKRTREVEKAFKFFIRDHLGDRPFSILHHSSNSHAALQVADYCMWAVHRKWTADDRRSYGLIRPFIRTELDLLRRGSEYFY